ncbi:MAG: Rieske 2Fe-2S domain-containing protein [Chloroflexi bacterium]|nr:Rieske 2Fe-2S domain-containing protein [Chloroflexota bacterium]
MLTVDENKLLTEVGPGKPMGELLRRFWLPALLSEELPGPDCDPIRTRTLGEDLVAFRDSNGKVGIVEAYCPHRRAPMFFGRNEEAGLRCVYHGWKFDCSGTCVDMPSEPPESNFKDKVKIKAYPTYETGGMIWIYMGPAAHQPARPPELPFTLLKDEDRRPGTKFLVEASFLQNLEGELDTAHISYLHSVMGDDGTGFINIQQTRDGFNNDRHPRLTVIDTDYGFVYGGRRRRPNGEWWWRVTQYLLPIYALIPGQNYNGGATIWMPIDDHHCWRYLVGGRGPGVTGQPQRAGGVVPTEKGQFTFPDGWTIDTLLPAYRKENLYGLDRQKQKTLNYTGIPTVPQQDQAMNEGMGHVLDRSKEHLGTTDIAVIAMRRRMMRMARELQQGIEPFAATHSEAYRVKPIDVNSPHGELAALLDAHRDDVRIPV